MTDALEAQRRRLERAAARSKITFQEEAVRIAASREHLKNTALREGVKRLLNQTPRPSYAAVAEELKCSRQRVHQVAVSLGLVGKKGRKQ
jgi:hypothetical protein